MPENEAPLVPSATSETATSEYYADIDMGRGGHTTVRTVSPDESAVSDPTSKAERLKAAQAEWDATDLARGEAYRAWITANRAWEEADRKLYAIREEAEP